jgi:hypothetical protein
MSKVARDINRSVRTGTSIPAKVTDVSFGKASVRLLSNGAVLHNLDVVGGPVKISQDVRVDFTTARPTIVVVGNTGISTEEVNNLVNARKEPPQLVDPPAQSSAPIDIYHNDEFVASVKGLNFVDGS